MLGSRSVSHFVGPTSGGLVFDFLHEVERLLRELGLWPPFIDERMLDPWDVNRRMVEGLLEDGRRGESERARQRSGGPGPRVVPDPSYETSVETWERKLREWPLIYPVIRDLLDNAKRTRPFVLPTLESDASFILSLYGSCEIWDGEELVDRLVNQIMLRMKQAAIDWMEKTYGEPKDGEQEQQLQRLYEALMQTISKWGETNGNAFKGQVLLRRGAEGAPKRHPYK